MKYLILILTLILMNAVAAPAAQRLQHVYFGTGGRGESKGIYRSVLDIDSGKLSEAVLAVEVDSPGFLALHPSEPYLYSVCALPGEGRQKAGGVTAFAIDRATGGLTMINQQSSVGAGPCHLAVDHSGQCVLVANYGGGSVAALPIVAKGALAEASAFVQHEGSSVNPKRQEGPHAHSVNVDPANRFAFVADLGLDKVLIYAFDAKKGSLKATGAGKVPPGGGPRHFAFHPSARFAYVINELASTITVFDYDAEKGTLTEIQTIPTLPDGYEGNNSTAEVQVHPSGKFVYGSNRGHDTIAAFRVDPAKGTLTFIEHEPIRGEVPRNFGIDPTGAYLLAAGQNSGTVAVFRIDGASGELDFAGSEIKVPGPICVKFLPFQSP